MYYNAVKTFRVEEGMIATDMTYKIVVTNAVTNEEVEIIKCPTMREAQQAFRNAGYILVHGRLV